MHLLLARATTYKDLPKKGRMAHGRTDTKVLWARGLSQTKKSGSTTPHQGDPYCTVVHGVHGSRRWATQQLENLKTWLLVAVVAFICCSGAMVNDILAPRNRNWTSFVDQHCDFQQHKCQKNLVLGRRRNHSLCLAMTRRSMCCTLYFVLCMVW